MVNLGSWVLIPSSGLFKPHFSDLYYFTRLTSDQWVSILPERLIKEKDTPPPSLKFWCVLMGYTGFPGGASGKEPICQLRRQKKFGFDPWVGKIPWRRAWQSPPVFMPGESHGQWAWSVTIHRVTKSQTWLKWLSTALHSGMHTYTFLLSISIYLSTFLLDHDSSSLAVNSSK